MNKALLLPVGAIDVKPSLHVDLNERLGHTVFVDLWLGDGRFGSFELLGQNGCNGRGSHMTKS